MNLKPAHAVKSNFLSLIHGAGSVGRLKQIHARLLISGAGRDRLAVAELIQSLAGFRNQVNYACRILQQVPFQLQSPFLLNLLFSGSSIGRNPRVVISLYKCAIGSGFFPNRYTFPVILRHCAKDLAIGEARQIHGVIFKLGFFCDIFVQNALLHVYGSCGKPEDARNLFDEMLVRDVVSWTGLISGYVKGGFLHEAVSLFQAMDEEPNEATLVSMLVAFGRLGHINAGRRIHGFVLKLRWENGLVVGNALLDMYVKSESLVDARKLFNELPHRDIISWTSIITGLVQCKQPKEALAIFRAMQASGLEPDKFGALEMGKWIHEFIDRRGILWDVHISTAMIDMYAKSGCIVMALHLFGKMPHKNIFSWNALLGGLAMHGFGRRVIDHYDQMIKSGVAPNEVTFIVLLGACSHSGLVREGRFFFNAMTEVYGLSPRIEHYGCMVDLLCRAELLEEAFDLIKAMPMEADALIWCSILGVCRAPGGNQISRQMIVDYIEESSPADGGIYVLLSNLYAADDRWRDATRIRRLMGERGIMKEPGSSLVAVGGAVEEFGAGGNNRHPREQRSGEFWRCCIATALPDGAGRR
ncbi:unnamed protein product [Spirodela intermedia]|uniref:Uncharacterized protein n=1 Tax=Spirodela intermedia TaxID=51605 RepID=A0A7I8JCD0_SPIIN|nr:unnamed protein product [Spirodela intermedia]CAA6667806.1 unnamed protein product [Spirodela intermedia]